MPGIKLSASSYEESKKKIIELRNANRSEERDEAYFDWRYTARPCDGKPLIVIAELLGSTIGSLSLIPHHYFMNGEKHSIGILGDISVSKEMRGRGIAKKMFSFLSGLKDLKDRMDACVVLPNEDAARPLRSAGWQTVAKIDRHVKLLSLRQTIEKCFKSKALADLTGPVSELVLKLMSREKFVGANDEYMPELIECFDDRFDNLWNEVLNEGICLGMRDRAYLSWRYSSHPIVKYQILAISHKEKLSGYLVFHLHKGICYVDDLLFISNNKTRTYLFTNFIDHVRKNVNASAIVINVNRNTLVKPALNQFGFIPRTDYLPLMAYCHNFKLDEQHLSGANWFLTAGDKDT